MPEAHLLCKPDAAGLGDPLPGMDACVDPDGGTVFSPSAELDKKNGEMLLGSCLGSLKGSEPRPGGPLLPGYVRWRPRVWGRHSGEVWGWAWGRQDRNPAGRGLQPSYQPWGE